MSDAKRDAKRSVAFCGMDIEVSDTFSSTSNVNSDKNKRVKTDENPGQTKAPYFKGFEKVDRLYYSCEEKEAGEIIRAGTFTFEHLFYTQAHIISKNKREDHIIFSFSIIGTLPVQVYLCDKDKITLGKDEAGEEDYAEIDDNPEMVFFRDYKRNTFYVTPGLAFKLNFDLPLNKDVHMSCPPVHRDTLAGYFRQLGINTRGFVACDRSFEEYLDKVLFRRGSDEEHEPPSEEVARAASEHFIRRVTLMKNFILDQPQVYDLTFKNNKLRVSFDSASLNIAEMLEMVPLSITDIEFNFVNDHRKKKKNQTAAATAVEE